MMLNELSNASGLTHVHKEYKVKNGTRALQLKIKFLLGYSGVSLLGDFSWWRDEHIFSYCWGTPQWSHISKF